jgi:galactokinase
VPPPATGDRWPLFVRGAVGELLDAGVPLSPCALEIRGDLPRGAGLASSAALSVALCIALCAAAGAEPPERVELARLCSRVENHWVGVRTGLLDQLAALFGERERAVRVDFRGPAVELVPLPLGAHRLVMLDSGAPRRLASSGYNRRRAECEAAARALGLASLRDCAPADLPRLDEPLRRRARHVVSENRRVEETAAALARGDIAAVGRLMDASHASLRDDYEVSVPAVEDAVHRARSAGALGARIHGGGFGGHVLALFPPDGVIPTGAIPVQPGQGARLLW